MIIKPLTVDNKIMRERLKEGEVMILRRDQFISTIVFLEDNYSRGPGIEVNLSFPNSDSIQITFLKDYLLIDRKNEQSTLDIPKRKW